MQRKGLEDIKRPSLRPIGRRRLARLLTNESLANKKAEASGGEDEQRLVLYSTDLLCTLSAPKYVCVELSNFRFPLSNP
jgi:hypothetical protein